ncbi:MAG TPA: response regulator transcription factor [Candidatus Paceibacterota bacterium]|nr:response regulator transcription factor [Candidatus Paceibacterota bacterium]
MKILVVEDEQRLAEGLAEGLARKGYAADIVNDGEKAYTRISLHRSDYDLVLLDLSLPSMSGAEVTREMRAHDIALPILVLTADASTDHKVELLLAGADDYLVKPFSFDELSARIQAILRRPKEALPAVITVSDLTLDPAAREATRDGAPLSLTLKEFGLLEYFMRHPNQVVNREDLIAHLWDFNYDSFSNVVDVHVKNLRRKLDDSGAPSILETVRGIGYRLRAA